MKLIVFGFIVGTVLLSTDAIKETTCGKHLNQHVERDSDDHSTDAGDWPWNAAIYHLSEETKAYKCAGTLIHTSVVLTAARCVFENNRKIIARRVQVDLGRQNLNDSGSSVQEFQVHEIIPHPSFNPSNLENDIAIIRLSTEATLNDYVQPVCLWQSILTDLSDVKNELGTVIGWGIIQSTTPQRSDELQQALMPVISKTNCRSSRTDFFSAYLYETSFCAGSRDGTNPCNGESGGSMTFEKGGVYSIRGILSRGVPKDGQINVCDPHEYFIFTDVMHFTPWITEVVPELDRTTPSNASAVCGFNEEFAVDKFRCEQSCEEYGDPLCVGNATEGRCYCKEGFVRLKAMDRCVAVDNLACRAKMPPTKETCDERPNQKLSVWLNDEPCTNTCENYNVPCNVTPPAGMFYGPHCVCKEGFSRLPNGKCIDIYDTKCRELWDRSKSTTPTTSTRILQTTIITTTATSTTTTHIVPKTPAIPNPKSARATGYEPNDAEHHPYHSPKQTPQPSLEPYEVAIGERIEMRCNIEGQYRPTTWRRVDGPLPQGSRLHGGILIIDVATHDAAGCYECTVREYDDEIPLLRTEIVLIEIPRITFFPSMPMEVHTGDTFEIDCNVTGEQPIRVHWHNEDFRPLPPSVNIRGSYMEFIHIRLKDAGRYYCTAENIHRNVTKVAEIIVNRNEIVGPNCDQVQNVCIAKNPCKNDGVCKQKGQDFVCDCPVGYTGDLCQHTSINPSVRLNCSMKGNGYLELNRSAFVDGPTQKQILIALMFSTTHPNGLLFWYGQNKQESYNGQDFVALAVVDGYLEYSFRLNSEEAMIKNIQMRVDSGERHIAIITRSGNLGNLELDGWTGYGESRLTDKLESYMTGNLFFGGAPDLNKFTGARCTHGFHGCIHVVEGSEDKAIHLGQNAVSGLHIDQCPDDDATSYLD